MPLLEPLTGPPIKIPYKQFLNETPVSIKIPVDDGLSIIVLILIYPCTVPSLLSIEIEFFVPYIFNGVIVIPVSVHNSSPYVP